MSYERHVFAESSFVGRYHTVSSVRANGTEYRADDRSKHYETDRHDLMIYCHVPTLGGRWDTYHSSVSSAETACVTSYLLALHYSNCCSSDDRHGSNPENCY